jgi:hypothetical protein
MNLQRARMQFSLKRLLAAIAISAVILAIISPWIRTIESERSWLFFSLAMTVVGGMAFTWINESAQQRKVEKRCGKRLLTALAPTRTILKCVGLMMTLAAVWSVVIIVWVVLIWRLPFEGGMKVAIHVFGLMVGFQVGNIRWKRVFGESHTTVDICQNGIVIAATTYLPWKSVRVCNWDIESGQLLIRGHIVGAQLTVPREVRSEMARILEQVADLPKKSS